MMAAILKEINLTVSTNLSSEKKTCETIYFGGGTPSLLTKDELQLILNALKDKFSFKDNIEITLEANPDDITPLKLKEWAVAGINRLSVGIQSFNDKELIWMNRAHNAQDSLNCIDQIKLAGFSNYSVDLIYGSPLLSDEDWLSNLAIITKKNIPHISCYALTVEPATALDKMIAQKKKQPVDHEKQAHQFLLLMHAMEQSGYEQYEISNFAKPGMRSQHNSSYWQGVHYVGFGPSAHSFDGTSRRWNIAHNALYIQSIENDIIPFEEELLTATQQLNEYIMTALRTMEGINLHFVQLHFGRNYAETLTSQSTKYITAGKLLLINDHLILSKEGKLFADGIAADLFF